MTKLMLVEDDNNLREIYGARLQAEGYDIVSAKDGEEALALAVKEKPDLIISDVMMPKISGFDMLDILRSTTETKHTKVIMMTALSQKEDQERGEKLGADKYLVKSQVTLEDVVRVVGEVLAENDETAEPSTETAAPTEQPAQAAPAQAPADEPQQSNEPTQDTTTAVAEPAAPAAEPSAPVAPPEPAQTSDNPAPATPSTDEPADAPVAEPNPEQKKTVDVAPEAAATPVAPETPQPTQEPAPASVATEQPADKPVAPTASTNNVAAPAATPAPQTPDTSEKSQPASNEPAPATPAEKPEAPVAETDAVAQTNQPEVSAEKTPEASPQAEPNATAQPPAPEAKAPEEPKPAEAETASRNGSKKGKVIQPINDPNEKPSIQELLAQEENGKTEAVTTEAAQTIAQEQAEVQKQIDDFANSTTPSSAPAPGTSIQPDQSESNQQPPTQPKADVNPNDISL